MIVGWDLATKANGWAAGDGTGLPTAGAFVLRDREQLGAMGCEFQMNVLAVHKRFPARHWVVEQPLLTPVDHRWTLQRIYGVTMLLFTLAAKLGITCRSVSHDDVKSGWAGPRASKAQMVEVCERLGISLPDALEDGRQDAADACGVWKQGVRIHAREKLGLIDGLIHAHRGFLI